MHRVFAYTYLYNQKKVRRRYHFNSFRKAQLLRARKYLNEVLLDQLPVLADMQVGVSGMRVAAVEEHWC